MSTLTARGGRSQALPGGPGNISLVQSTSGCAARHVHCSICQQAVHTGHMQGTRLN